MRQLLERQAGQTTAAGLYLLLIGFLAISLRLTFGLPQLPESITAETEYIYFENGESLDLFKIQEFIDTEEGSVRLNVLNFASSNSGGFHKLIEYYRIREKPNEYDDFDNSLVKYSKSLTRCFSERTNFWYLKQLTFSLEDMYRSADLQTDGLDLDRTSIGPIGLLRVVYANADKFLLDSRGFDEVQMYQTYYFSMSFVLSETQVVRIVCVLPSKLTESKPDNNDEDEANGKLKIGETRLSQINSKVHVSRIVVLTMSKSSKSLKTKSVTLLDLNANDLELQIERKLIVAYVLIQQRSLSKHTGASGQASDFESRGFQSNPFSLPPGLGCGLVSDHVPFYISAKQFSATFEAHEFNDKFYMAYDEPTNHLRYDTLNENKIIYSLNERRATLIPDDVLTSGGGEFSSPSSAAKESSTSVLGRDCAQSVFYLGSDELENTLFSSKSIEHILGLGSKTSLRYLGTQVMPSDGLVCHVYEREISPKEIPAIVALHTRLKIRPGNSLYLIFYFVNELDSSEETSGDSASFKSAEAHETCGCAKLSSFRLFRQ